jgi:HlyD family secretion protein
MMMQGLRLKIVRLAGLWLAALLLAGCGARAQPTPLPTLALPATSGSSSQTPVNSGGAVTASGEVVPVDQVQLGFATAGVIAQVNFKEGDMVQAGSVLASQENTALLDLAVKSAQQNLDVARKNLETLKTDAASNLANAQLTLATAQKNYDDAIKHRKVKDYHRCDQDTIDLYGQLLTDAQDRLKRLKENNEGINTTYLQKLTKAQDEVDIANSNYLYCLNFTAQEVAESDASIAVADAALKDAKSRLGVLTAGSGIDPDETARLQAQVTAADLALANAQNAFNDATLVSTTAGTVISLDAKPGQTVLPGQPVVTVCSLDNLQVETTDLSERDIARVSVGQAAKVRIEALGKEVAGKVLRIVPKATKVGGDVVFKVIIRLDEQPKGLLWGMSVKVDLGN